MELNGLFQKSKRSRSESISGRLRAASDLEEIGWIDKSQKGVIKDLIISGDETLRRALDKYEDGDAHDLEGALDFYSKECLSTILVHSSFLFMPQVDIRFPLTPDNCIYRTSYSFMKSDRIKVCIPMLITRK